MGSRVARWESCSLKALSFSSYWLGEGQQPQLLGGGFPTRRGPDPEVPSPTSCVHPSLPPSPPRAPTLPALFTGGGGAPDVCSLGWAQAVSQGCGTQGQGRRPGHSPLHSLQQQRLPLRQFVLEGQAAAGGRPSPAPPTAPTPWARPHWLGWRSLQQPAPPPGPSRSVPCRRAQCPPHKCHFLGKVSAAGQALASL